MKLFLSFLFITSFNFLGGAQSWLLPEEILSQYVQCNSITGSENEAGEYMLGVYKKVGLYTKVFHNEPGKINFCGSLYPLESNKPNIIFHNHIDVVAEGEVDKWTYPPFSGKIAEGAVWGRGSIDNKGLCIMQFEALRKFIPLAKEKDLPYNITILNVSSEEIGGIHGAKCVSEECMTDLNAVVVFGEGGTGIKYNFTGDGETEIQGISVAEKSALWFQLRIEEEGHYSHASVNSNENIVEEMVRLLKKIARRKPKVWISPTTKNVIKYFSEYETGIRKFVFRNIRLFKPLVKNKLLEDQLIASMVTEHYKITQIHTDHGSGNSNTNFIAANFDGRFLRQKTRKRAEKRIKRLVAKSRAKFVEYQVTPPTLVSEPEEFYHFYESALQKKYKDVDVLPIQFPAYCDNNYFRNAGVPTYGNVPVCMTQDMIKSIHNINERLPIKLLYDGIDVYKLFIEMVEGISQKSEL